jgi:hypothetical protein
MFYIPIQKDFSKVKNKVALGLTKRQCICFACAAVIGIPTYMMVKQYIATDIAGVIMIVVMIPFFMFAMYQKEGMPLEQILKSWIKEKYVRPQIRPVRNEPLLMGVMQTAAYIEEQERLKKESEEHSFTKKVTKKIWKEGRA